MMDKTFFTGSKRSASIVGNESGVVATFGAGLTIRADYVNGIVTFSQSGPISPTISRKITQICSLLELPYQSYILEGALLIQNMETGSTSSNFPITVHMPHKGGGI